MSFNRFVSGISFHFYYYRAKSVKNFAVINEDVGEQALLSTYEKEIKRLRRYIMSCYVS